MQFACHLSFEGTCEAAFSTYHRIIGGGDLSLMTYGESPLSSRVPADWHSKILHATLKLGDHELLGADVFPGTAVRHDGFAVVLEVTGADRGKEIFDALAEGGQIRMPFQQTFWSPGYGMLVDRFGVPWEINSTSTDQEQRS